MDKLVPTIEPIKVKQYEVKQSKYPQCGKLPVRSILLSLVSNEINSGSRRPVSPLINLVSLCVTLLWCLASRFFKSAFGSSSMICSGSALAIK